jgi:hypothetical protein
MSGNFERTAASVAVLLVVYTPGGHWLKHLLRSETSTVYGMVEERKVIKLHMI